MSKVKILISFVYKKYSTQKFPLLKKSKYFVQNKPYSVGFRIENIDKKTSPQIIIKNFKIIAGEIVSHSFEEEVTISRLNPGEDETIWLPNSFAPLVSGATWLECDLSPKSENIQVKTYQRESACGSLTAVPLSVNKWGDGLYIRGELEHGQDKTNRYVMFLTILILAEGIWGVRTVLYFIIKTVGQVFVALGNLFLFS